MQEVDKYVVVIKVFYFSAEKILEAMKMANSTLILSLKRLLATAIFLLGKKFWYINDLIL